MITQRSIFASFVFVLLLFVSSASATPDAYVASTGDLVYVVDTATNQVVSKVDIGYQSFEGVATPDGSKIYMSDQYSISVIDTATNQVAKHIETGVGASLVMSADGKHVYVRNAGGIDVINTETDTFRTLWEPETDSVQGVAVSPDGSTLYVLYKDENNQGHVAVMNAATGNIVNSIAVSGSPNKAVVTPDGKKLYVAEQDAIEVVDLATYSVKKIDTGFNTYLLEMSPSGDKVYAGTENKVAVISTRLDTIVVEAAFQSTSDSINGMALTPDGGKLYVSTGNGVWAVETATNQIVAEVPVGATPNGIVMAASNAPVTPSVEITSFTAAPDSGRVPFDVIFTAEVKGTPVRYAAQLSNSSGTIASSEGSWSDFANGKTFTFGQELPAGEYTETLQVWDADGNADAESVTVTVLGPEAPAPIKIVKLTATPNSGYAPFESYVDIQISGTPVKGVATLYRDGLVMSRTNLTNFASGTLKFTAADLPGNYSLAIQVWDAAGNTNTKSVDLKVLMPPAPDAKFTANVTSGQMPLTVQFTDQSTNNPIMWDWAFGDGTTSKVQNPTHTYAKAGIYTVTLVTGNWGGADFEKKLEYIVVVDTQAGPIKIEKFTATPNSGRVPFDVNLNAQINGLPILYEMTVYRDNVKIGGKTGTSMNLGKMNFGSNLRPGAYQIVLQVWNAAGNTDTKSVTITVLPSLKPEAQFTASVVSGKAPLTVKFTDQSTNNPAMRYWVFGDGTTSTALNPTHTYAKAGTYTVALVAKNAGGADLKLKKQYITVSSKDAPRFRWGRFIR
ncbi:MAG: PKD domain-containing protein [Alphaproteobacteria bacterium]|nr:PKD domain-containing protein [Alphaproteobacteria bacterium]